MAYYVNLHKYVYDLNRLHMYRSIYYVKSLIRGHDSCIMEYLLTFPLERQVDTTAWTLQLGHYNLDTTYVNSIMFSLEVH